MLKGIILILCLSLLSCQHVNIKTLKLKSLDGSSVEPLSVKKGFRANVLCFITTDCPIANGYSQTFNRLTKAYQDKGFRFILVHVDPDTTREKALQHQKDFDLQAEIILDPDHELAKATLVSITPEAAVVMPDQKVAYRGRINNLYAGYGKKRNVITKTELKDALDAITEGRAIDVVYAPAIGCEIPEI